VQVRMRRRRVRMGTGRKRLLCTGCTSCTGGTAEAGVAGVREGYGRDRGRSELNGLSGLNGLNGLN